jgi:peptidoglycan L-alanyl-D-glutamate endopeptidase CwlK
MINSRRLEDLLPVVKAKVECMISECKEVGIDLLVTSTYRDHASQDALYAQGRTKPGKIVTNAKAGQSFHNFRCAVDVVPLVNGKPMWDAKNPIWQQVGAIGKSCGLEWAGDWKRFKEYPHFQYTGGLTLKDLQNGKEVK